MITNIVVVDRSHIFGKPPYCIHGESLCIRCEKGVWLGSKTVEAVKSGLMPICMECVIELRTEGVLRSPIPVDHIRDHLRADGPH